MVYPVYPPKKSIAAAAILVVLASLLPGTPVGAEDGTGKSGSAPDSIKITEPFSGDRLATVGGSNCLAIHPILPAYCAHSAFRGGVWDISHLNFPAPLSVVQGNITVQIVVCNLCGGLNITLGNDRDDDGFVTNLDIAEDDLLGGGPACTQPGAIASHGTSCWFDDQWVWDHMREPVWAGDVLRMPFCFAHDGFYAGHDFDDLSLFTSTPASSPTVAIISAHLGTLDQVGYDTNDCSSIHYDNTMGTGLRPAPASPPQCSDGVDNDGDGWTDHPSDPGCSSASDSSESPNPQCSDGIDNDGDGRVDYWGDQGCVDKYDNDECDKDFRVGHAQTSTSGGGYGTKVDARVGWDYNRAACPGGPWLVGYDGECEVTPGSGWSNTACNWDTSLGYPVLEATFTCTSSACSGAVSPHSLSAGVFLDDSGAVGCIHSRTATIPLSNYGTHCEPH